jgi:hypothetical protein
MDLFLSSSKPAPKRLAKNIFIDPDTGLSIYLEVLSCYPITVTRPKRREVKG